METTQEDRDAFRVALNTAFFLPLSATLALLNDADRLAAIERQVLWRTEDMLSDALVWSKNKKVCYWWRRDDNGMLWVIEGAPDYRPDEPGPIWLPILDPPEGS